MHALTRIGIGGAVAATAFTAGIVAPAIGARDGDRLASPTPVDVLAPAGVGACFGTLGAQRGTSLLGKVGWGAVGLAAGAAIGATFGAGMYATKARFD